MACKSLRGIMKRSNHFHGTLQRPMKQYVNFIPLFKLALLDHKLVWTVVGIKINLSFFAYGQKVS